MRKRRFRTVAAALALAAAVGLRPAHGAVSIYLPPDALAASAPIVVEGTVERVASGYDPVDRTLSTYVTLRVAAVHRGPADLARIVLREPGGRYGDVSHELDAVPVYRPGESVLVFAEPARDGALRTAGMFFGKYVLLDGGSRGRRALREMSGRGLILRAPPEVMEELPLSDLTALIAATPLCADPAAPPALAAPREIQRVLWDPASEQEAPPSTGSLGSVASAGPAAGRFAATDAPPAAAPDFATASFTDPARWDEADSDLAISVDVERARNPLGDGAAALAEIARAMAAWTAVPESRIALRVGNGDAAFTAAVTRSPARALPPSNIILFGDPYDDLSDPIDCAGTLAMGGYWRSTAGGKVVNGVSFHPIKRMYVIFNRSFECFLSDPRDLAEVATHELGHGVGLGHSTASGSIMRAFAYGDRGAVLAPDDRDAVQCVYPQAFTVSSPNGGGDLDLGDDPHDHVDEHERSGGNPGTVTLEWSPDDGTTWQPIAQAERNDGSFDWTVPGTAGIRNRVRVVRRTSTGVASGGFPAACTQDASNGSFTIRPSTGSRPPIRPTSRRPRS